MQMPPISLMLSYLYCVHTFHSGGHKDQIMSAPQEGEFCDLKMTFSYCVQGQYRDYLFQVF
jgi:hypothetical protein